MENTMKTTRIKKHKGIMSYTSAEQRKNRNWHETNVYRTPHVQSARPKWQVLSRIRAAISRAARKISRPTY